MHVKEIMTRRAISISPDTTLADAAKKMRDADVGCLLVEAGNKLVGVITDRDITCKGLVERPDALKVKVSEIMSRDLVWCKEDEDVEDAIRLMEQRKVRRLPVLGKDNHAIGMLSVGDVSTHLSHELSGEVIEAVSTPGA